MKRIYYGWYVVAITMVIYMVVVGSTICAFGIFVLPVSAEMNLSRAEMNTAISLLTLGNAVQAPIIGRILDRVAAKTVMIMSAFVYTLSMVSLGLSHSLRLSSLIILVCVPVAYLGAGSLTNTLLIARWFTAQRGRAMVLAGLGMSLGNLVGPPLVGLLVVAEGWRTALLIIGPAVGSLLLTLGLIVRERPGPNDIEPALEPGTSIHSAGRSAYPASPIKILALLRMPQFWAMTMAAALVLATFTTITISFVPIGRASGLSTLQAAGLQSATGAAAIIGALIFAAIADRIDRVILLSALFLLSALVNAMLGSGGGYSVLLTCAIMFGVCTGTVTHTFYALLADRFGTVSFGTVRGLSMLLFSSTGAIMVRVGGAMFDRAGDYKLMFSIYTAICLASAALIFATRFIRRGAGAASPA
jgi:MFS family permease